MLNLSASLHWPPVLLALIMMGLQPAAVASSKDDAGAAQKQAVAAALDIPLLDLQGKHQMLKQWSGQPLLINYWASWCAPCVKEMPDLDAFSKSQASHGVRVVGIAMDEVDAVHAFLERVPVSFPILIEGFAEDKPGTAALFGEDSGVLPYSVLLDAQGRIVRTKLGPLSHDELDAWAQELRSPASKLTAIEDAGIFAGTIAGPAGN